MYEVQLRIVKLTSGSNIFVRLSIIKWVKSEIKWRDKVIALYKYLHADEYAK